MSRVFSLIFLFFVSVVQGAQVPALTGRVNDYASMLDRATFDSINRTLETYENATTNQVVVLTVNSLEGETVEAFATKVFNEWKLGVKGKNNGVLLLIAKNDKRMKIEVGYGLEGTLTDLQSGRITREVISPQFKGGKFSQGIDDGVKNIIHILSGEKVTFSRPHQVMSPSKQEENNLKRTSAFFIVLGGMIFGGILSYYFFLFGGIVLSFASGVAAHIYWHENKLTIIAAVIGFIIGCFLKTIFETLSASSGGSSDSGSWSSSSDSGGGYSGGGGSSGGGGASGDW